MPVPMGAVATSDQRVSLCRSSNGKSNSVASICVVSSMDTCFTQLKSSPTGSESRMLHTRSRISGSSADRFRGPATGATTLRCSSCFGGSMAMNMGSWKSSSSSSRVMPPSDEKIWWFMSTCLMSWYFVTDQYGPNSLSAVKCTGSSLRRRSKYGQWASFWNSTPCAGSMSASGSVYGSATYSVWICGSGRTSAASVITTSGVSLGR